MSAVRSEGSGERPFSVMLGKVALKTLFMYFGVLVKRI